MAKRHLRRSDATRKFALETAKLGYWELDPDTLQATRSVLHDQIFGYPAPLPEWSFDIFMHHVHPEDRERISENFRTCSAREYAGNLNAESFAEMGDAMDLGVRRPLSGLAKGDANVWHRGRHNRAQTGAGSTRESEERFQALANGIPQLAWMAERTGRFSGSTSAGMTTRARRWSRRRGGRGKACTIRRCCPRCWNGGKARLRRARHLIWSFRCGGGRKVSDIS